MILLFTDTDECIEVPEGEKVAVRDGLVLCMDRAGNIVKTFPAQAIKTYTTDEAVAEVIQDEVCDDEEAAEPA
jgi:hypothetical protein